MTATIRIVVLFFVSLVLAACGQREVADTKAATQTESTTLQSLKSAEEARKEKEREEDFLRQIRTKALSIEFKNEGFLLMYHARQAIEELRAVDREDLYLGSLATTFDHRAMKGIDPQMHDVSYEAGSQARRLIRNAFVGWAVNDVSILDTVWITIRPALRSQYGLLKALRKQEKLFTVPYTRKGWKTLIDCLNLSEAISPAQSKRCDAEFKKFGITPAETVAGEEHLDYSVRNAEWIVKFLDRREGDGGEKFAQLFQKYARDYIK